MAQRTKYYSKTDVISEITGSVNTIISDDKGNISELTKNGSIVYLNTRDNVQLNLLKDILYEIKKINNYLEIITEVELDNFEDK